MDPTILTFVAFVVISAAAAGVLLWARSRYARRLSTAQPQAGASKQPPAIPRRRPSSEVGAPDGVAGAIDRWFGRLVTDTGVDLAPLTAFLIAVAAGLLLGGLAFLWRDAVLAGIAGLALGMFLVLAVFFYLRSRRRMAFLNQLPEVMEFLARAVRAGESLEQAIELVGNTVVDPLGAEFRICARQLDIGLSAEAAMQSLTRRVPVAETQILAATLMVQRQSGGNLPLTLERMARVFRDRASYRRQLRASTAVVRSSIAVIVGTAVLTAAYALIWRPTYSEQFLTSPEGQTMLAVAVGLQVVGMVWSMGLLRSNY